MALEQIGKNSPDLARLPGQIRPVISGEGATRTLLATESGSLVLFDRGAGIVYTLPAPVVGVEFEFLTTVIGTLAYSIVTDAATTFIGGGLAYIGAGAAESDIFAATIASDVRIDLDAATTGEEVGSRFTLTCLSATTWGVGGYVAGTGTGTTPFA
jgi:hypothetical protein